MSRIMTKEDIEKTKWGDVFWQETYSGDSSKSKIIYSIMRMKNGQFVDSEGSIYTEVDPIGIEKSANPQIDGWEWFCNRFWNEKPTEKEMKETEWHFDEAEVTLYE